MKKHQAIRLAQGRISFLTGKRENLVILLLFLFASLTILMSACLGDRFIDPLSTTKAIFGYGTKLDEMIIMSFRMPRILIAFIAGVCLAAAGAILQGLIRNPLASPDIIGITGGASCGVVLFYMLFADKSSTLSVSLSWLPVAAFIGASLVGFIVYMLSYQNGLSTFRLIIIGIGFSMFTQAMTSLLMIKGPFYRASQANVFITGSVYGTNWSQFQLILPMVVILLIICLFMSKHVNIQALGKDVAAGVGNSVQKSRFFLLLLSIVLTACAVSVAGTVGFVGLMAPHMARRLVGSSFGALLPVSALLGGELIMIADIIGRTLFSPIEIPAGVFTAAVGAPYFLYLLYRSRRTSISS
ncbi:FecCD family ABC transporter permease [Bacillus stratosphericus]|uniref:FecCD family ABC transporter permease n=1 Tax=Bacillus stratosphericus TaxID=293386 RepID=UPI001CFB92B3|nr:iron ABC transporter permease [Bacillus stratosphericus]